MTSNHLNSPLTSQEIKQQALNIGFHQVGIAHTNLNSEIREENQERLANWLNKGYQAEMSWMDNPKRFDVTLLEKEAKSIICVALNYYTPHQHQDSPDTAKISRYGWGRDYHRIMGKKLKQLTRWLEEKIPEVKAKYYVDTAPIQDKFWAQQAGIGWVAKNANVITKKYGSWVFLGEIVTNLHLEADKPHTNHCGTCTRCLESCPTGAITEPFVVNANLCIAYHTIENRSPSLPENIANNLNGWVAGCDICQDVCPWNQRFAQPTDIEDFYPYSHNLNPKLTDLAQMTEEEWDKRFQASALRRIKPFMWRRNAQAHLSSEFGVKTIVYEQKRYIN